MLINKILKWFVFFFGAFLFIYNLIFFTWESTKIVSYYHSGTLRSDVKLLPDSSIVFSKVDTVDFSVLIYPQIGDTIVSIDDTTAGMSLWNLKFNSPLEPGRVVPIEFNHNGNVFRTALITSPIRTFDFIGLLAIDLLRFLAAISFIIVGSWAYFQRPDSGGIRSLTMFSYSISTFLITAVNVLSTRYASFTIPFGDILNEVFNTLVPFFSAFWLNLQLLFPHPHKFIRTKPLLAYLGCYAPGIIFIFLYEVFGINSSIFIFLLISIQVFLGFGILYYSYRHSTDKLERRQMRLVLMGSGFSLFTLFSVLLIAVLFNEWLSNWGGFAFLIIFCFFSLLFSPLSFAYAFQRYRLFEVEAKLRRGTRYFIAITALLAVSLGILYLISQLVMTHLGITSRTPTMIIAMGFAFGFIPAFKAIRDGVEKQFYPEKLKLKHIAAEATQKMLSFPDCKSLWSHLESRLTEALSVESLYPIVRFKDSNEFYLEKDKEETTPFRLNNGISQEVIYAKGPIFIDEAIASERTALSLEEESWLIARNVALLMPMFIRNELIGYIGLGQKAGKEEFSPEEISMLSSLAYQIAMASDNIRLLEESLVKKRMEEELQLARDIQKGFLPAILPDTPGLEISAGSKFCHEVAGDYYDVLISPPNKTVLAVGDVSGKGAGAALLMANLQASLRTAVGITVQLNEIVERVNELIYRNTPPEQYITFFAGIFDADKKTITFVNAGHNFPAVIRDNEETILLQEGGIILGCLPSWNYKQETLELKTGDILVMYTDGVTEAMNEAEEEFGEQRLLQYIRDNSCLNLDELRTGIEKQVGEFTGGKPLLDDFTLILVRVK